MSGQPGKQKGSTCILSVKLARDKGGVDSHLKEGQNEVAELENKEDRVTQVVSLGSSHLTSAVVHMS